MASRSLGVLSLDLIAKIGGFVAGLTQAERQADKSAKAMEASFKSVNVAAYALGNTLGSYLKEGIDALAGAFPAMLEKAAKFQDLSEEIGASAEDIASFSVAAATAGVDISSFAAASVKLTKSLVGVDDESKAAGAALAALGINVAEFKKLDPAAQYEGVGKALAGYADGAGKTAVAVALFGKAGAEQLKVFKALEEQGGRTKILTAEQIALADAQLDAQAKLREELSLYASAIATNFIAPMNEVIKIAIQTAKELSGLGGEAKTLGGNAGVKAFAEGAAIAIAYLIENIGNGVAALGTMGRAAQLVGANLRLVSEVADVVNPASIAKNLVNGTSQLDNIKKAYGENQDAFATLTKSFQGLVDRSKASEGKKLKDLFEQRARVAEDPEIKRLAARAKSASDAQLKDLAFSGAVKPAKGGGGAKDDPTKKLLDNDLAYFKAQGDAAKELLADRNKMLDLYNSQGLLSVKDYYAAQQGNLDEATRAQAKSIDDQIAALQKFKDAAKKDTDIADTTGKINKLEEEKAKLYRASGSAAIESSIKQAQAQKDVLAAFNEVNAKVLEYQGNLRAAGEIRFDAQNEKLIAQAQAEGNQEIVERIQLLKQYTLAQADINKLSQQFSLAQGDLSIQEERITQARERGTMGEIQALKASGDARKAAVAIMQQQLAAFQAIDAAARTPEQNQAIERLKVQLEGLQATIDPLADRINTMFSDAAGNAFGDFINGTKTAKQAFKDFANAVLQDIGRMVAKDLAKQLFGGSGKEGGGGIGGLFSSLFNSSGKGGGTDALGDFITSKGFASGGFTGVGAANDPAGIVHKGEYVLTADQTRKIGVANLDRGNFGGQVVNFAIEGQVDRRTQSQIANRMRRTQNVAAARFA